MTQKGWREGGKSDCYTVRSYLKKKKKKKKLKKQNNKHSFKV
jgi:hypothetical protein